MEVSKLMLIEEFLEAKEQGSLETGMMNEIEEAGMYLHTNREFIWLHWMDKDKVFWKKVERLIKNNQE